MQSELESLKALLDGAHHRGTDGRRIFSKQMRAEVVAFAERWRAAGGTVTSLAEALEIKQANLWNWLGRRNPSAPMCARKVLIVEDVPEPKDEPEPKRFTAILPSGIRVRGLTLADLVVLAREVR